MIGYGLNSTLDSLLWGLYMLVAMISPVIVVIIGVYLASSLHNVFIKK